MSKLNLKLLSECEKGYVIGFFLGDGSFNKGRKSPRFIVRFALDEQRDQDIAVRLADIFKKGCKKASVFSRDNNLIVKVCSKELVNYVLTFVEYRPSGSAKKEKLFLMKENYSKDFKLGILAGIIDSDGHVHGHFGTEIKTVSPSMLNVILDLLNAIGIETKVKKRDASTNSYSKKSCYAIYIPSKSMKAFQSRIPSVKIERASQLHLSLPRKLN
jgi:intein/homing endonuclease